MTPLFIAGSSIGLVLDKKPFLVPDQAFTQLRNAFIYRERTVKKPGLQFLGRLRRVLQNESLGNSNASPWSFNIYTLLSITGESNAEINCGSVVITIQDGAGDIVFTDQADGTLTSPTPGNSGTINYTTGAVVLTHTAGAGDPTLISFSYYPTLPVTGIYQRELASVNDEETIFFDTKYAYRSGSGLNNFSQVGTATWAGSDSDLFWAANYRGAEASSRLFFVTNFVNDAADPIRYTDDGVTWNDLYPVVSQSGGVATRRFISQAKIIIPYYGRLVFLNTWEIGADGAGNPDYANNPQNYFNRASFCQIGSPLETTVALPIVDTSWRIDQFGRGGFIDAPTNESIVGAKFIKNTLLVFFERSTWNLRYQGEYGIPFIWERVSSDFGSESKCSSVLFDNGIIAVGDKGIISADATNVRRIDEQIPDAVFGFRNANNGIDRVVGVRDFQREFIYWCYSNSNTTTAAPGADRVFPNQVLAYNYRTGAYSVFDDKVTFFGTYQPPLSVTWADTNIFWGDYDVYWQDPDSQSQFPRIVSGNQQGFIHYYGYSSIEEESLYIQNVIIPASASDPVELVVPNYNLQDGDIIYLTGIEFEGGAATDLNDRFFLVKRGTVANRFSILEYDASSDSYIEDYTRTPASGTTYIGCGRIRYFPKMVIDTKDFNPYQASGNQFKFIYGDFLFDETEDASVSVELFINSKLNQKGNLLTGNQQVESYPAVPYYPTQSQYAWHRFYATTTGQYLRLRFTYNDAQMNTISIHRQPFVLNAFTLYFRPGGKTVFP